MTPNTNAARALATSIVGVAIVCSTQAADTATHGPSWGVHGMALFGGREGLFASHLPMFHPPHDAQVIMRVHFKDAAVERQVRKALAQRPELWTVVPEQFELDRLAPAAADPIHHLQVDVVHGHFERGGKTVRTAREMVVDQVLVYRKLQPTGKPGDTADYMAVAASPKVRERFFMKVISTRPDVDQIVEEVVPRGAKPVETLHLPRDQDVSAAAATITQAFEAAC
ncbi:MAG: hypothetical protein JO218_07915, partial [Burkholderiales bacterium]|nr:hypothetical protein [Burkholderiales bacterium]